MFKPCFSKQAKTCKTYRNQKRVSKLISIGCIPPPRDKRSVGKEHCLRSPSEALCKHCSFLMNIMVLYLWLEVRCLTYTIVQYYYNNNIIVLVYNSMWNVCSFLLLYVCLFMAKNYIRIYLCFHSGLDCLLKMHGYEVKDEIDLDIPAAKFSQLFKFTFPPLYEILEGSTFNFNEDESSFVVNRILQVLLYVH